MEDALLRSIFERARWIRESELVQRQVQDSAVQCRQKLNKARAGHTKAVRELAKWEDLMLGSIEGACVFSPEQLERRMDTVQQTLLPSRQKGPGKKLRGSTDLAPKSEDIIEGTE